MHQLFFMIKLWLISVSTDLSIYIVNWKKMDEISKLNSNKILPSIKILKKEIILNLDNKFKD